MEWPTPWRVEDLKPGMVIYDPLTKRMDPVTREATSEYRKLLVVAVPEAFPGYKLVPYDGTEDGVWPPGFSPPVGYHPWDRIVERMDGEAMERIYRDLKLEGEFRFPPEMVEHPEAERRARNAKGKNRVETWDEFAARQLRELDEQLTYVRAGKPLPPEFQQRDSASRREKAEFYATYVVPAVDALVSRVRAGTDTDEDRRVLNAIRVSRESIRDAT
jgi:hypothetical protein